jgi:hypothetical protein
LPALQEQPILGLPEMLKELPEQRPSEQLGPKRPVQKQQARSEQKLQVLPVLPVLPEQPLAQRLLALRLGMPHEAS